MPRLVNTETQMVVSVSDEKATRMGAAWVPLEPPPVPKKRGRPKKVVEEHHGVD